MAAKKNRQRIPIGRLLTAEELLAPYNITPAVHRVAQKALAEVRRIDAEKAARKKGKPRGAAK
ncbi:MAG TPA: hypothetical protein VGR02_17865 [Thermoanaerobaculia bacterium]|jgi:hypothetical protein|nr:hypothetical protein [Thermoanaerobaculia bacterium]